MREAATRIENIAKKKRDQEQVDQEVLRLQASFAIKDIQERIRGGDPDTPVQIVADEEEDDGYIDDEGEYDTYTDDNSRASGSWKYKPPVNSPL